MDNTTANGTAIIGIDESTIVRKHRGELVMFQPGKTGLPAMQHLQEINQAMAGFSFNWNMLKKVLDEELAHFAVQTGQNEVRVFTKDCVFSINLATTEAGVSLTETMWLMELAERASQNDKLKKDLDECRASFKALESFNDDLRARHYAMNESHTCVKSMLAKEEKRAKHWASRCMKMVAKARKNGKAGKAKRQKA